MRRSLLGFPLKGWIRVILSGIYKGTIIIRNLRRVEGSRAFNLFAASIRLMDKILHDP